MSDVILNGRIVGGHPMNHASATDDNGKPKIDSAGNPMHQTFYYFAVPKAGSTDFKTTEFGQAMLAEAKAAWPKGEYNAPDFAWKVIDGDSTVPMKGGKPAPSTREGFPGNWVLRLTTGIPVRCYHNGKYNPMEQIQDKNAIKCGDYGRTFVTIKPNNSAQSPGLYVNPTLFSLDRAGELIVTEGGPSAADVFGGKPVGGAGAPPSHPASPVAPTSTVAAVAPPASPPPPPHNPLPKMYVASNGEKYTREQLQGFGFTAEQIDALPTA